MAVSTRPVLTAASTVADILRDYDKLDAGIVLDHVKTVLCAPISECLPLLNKLGAEGYAAIPAIEARIKAQIVASVPKGASQQFSIKVSEKGAVSIRGIKGINVKFGLTMYAIVFEELFARREVIEKFIADNASKLARK